MTPPLRTLIVSYISTSVQMTITTVTKDQPWAAVVFYAYDDALNLYFLSDQRTRHSREINSNSKVAVTINKEWNEPSPVKGIQIEGVAQVVAVNELAHAFTTYVKRFPSTKDFITDVKVFMDKAFNTRIFKVTPSKIYLLDEVNMGPGKRKILYVTNNKEEDANLPS